MNAFILCIGNEILEGQILSSNSQFLSAMLEPLGMAVTGHMTVPDTTADIHHALDFARERAKWVLITGGLGPTFDDITRNAIAEYCQVPLQLNPQALDAIAERFRRSGLTMNTDNKIQAYIPQGTDILPNHWGTAPGFRIQKETSVIFVLPGVPHEMKAMAKKYILPELQQLSKEVIRIRSARIFGYP